MSALVWRKFTEHDWLAFAGAESFPDGGAPMMAELKVNGLDALAIVDNDGLHVLAEGDMNPETLEEEGGVELAIFDEGNPVRGMLVALQLRAEMTTDELVALGLS